MAAPSGVCPALVGPTAAGKTALVTALAGRLPLEVISLDSRQIYRGLVIGTAQPTAAERALCPHHLIDCVDPDERYSAQRFRTDFTQVHREIIARGGVPLLVGGAGLYLTALREGFMAIPGHSPERLAEVRAELAPLDDRAVRARLAQVDPQAHRRIHAGDRVRSQRALEVCLVSGRTLTALQADQRPDPALGLAFPAYVLEREVAELDARIAGRTAAMLAGGWLEETRGLLRRYRPDGPGLSSIGYREVVAHLRGELPADALAPAVVRATRQYAKRQRTWFRHVEAAGRFPPDDPALREALAAALSGPAA
ncbi:MAG: tRNA (adenosine(37)-N6)-dimethylallyltransferase MiaA [Candidatus Krumholzibacteriia bacterium]